MSVSIDTIYCLATGKPIGTVDDNELGLILESGRSQEELERLTLLSMRPSIIWMSVTPASLDSIRESAPRQLLAYLMNRMYAHVDSPQRDKLFDIERKLSAHRMRIDMWDRIEYGRFNDEELDGLLMVLLTLDTRFNLSRLTMPQAVATHLDDWPHTWYEELTKLLWDWHNRLIGAEQAQIRRQKAQAEFWSPGNQLARKAMAAQFEKVTPPSINVAAKKAKIHKIAEDLDFLNQLEKELMQGTGAMSEATPVIKPKPVFKLGVKLGVVA